MSKKYKNPPVIEALCEFRFKDNPWNIMYPGEIYREVKNDYPVVKQMNFQTLQPDGGLFIENRLQFVKEDSSGIIQITDLLLSIHVLKTYKSWKDFYPEIKKIFNIYSNISNPKKLSHIALRYVNKINIEMESESIELKDYFDFYPFMGNNLPKTHGQFSLNVVTPYENGQDFLKLGQKTPPFTKEKLLTVILDLDYFSNRFENNIDTGEIFSWIDNAHTNLEGVFEGCITDKLREKFHEVKDV